MPRMSKWDWVAIVLVIVGAVNWGLVGVANYNLVTQIINSSFLVRLVYTLVGIAGIYSVYSLFKK